MKLDTSRVSQCVNDHVADRFTSNGQCVGCRENDKITKHDEWVAYQVKYAADNAEKKRQIAQDWATANPERNRARAAAWGASNQSKTRVHACLYRQRNPEKSSEAIKAWGLRNPMKLRLYSQKRRAAAMGSAIGDVTSSSIDALRLLQNDACVYCYATLSGGGELDHIVALAVGGPHAMSNLQWTCSSCNRQKNTKTDAEFRIYQAGLKNVDQRPLRSARLRKVSTLACDV